MSINGESTWLDSKELKVFADKIESLRQIFLDVCKSLDVSLDFSPVDRSSNRTKDHIILELNDANTVFRLLTPLGEYVMIPPGSDDAANISSLFLAQLKTHGITGHPINVKRYDLIVGLRLYVKDNITYDLLPYSPEYFLLAWDNNLEKDPKNPEKHLEKHLEKEIHTDNEVTLYVNVIYPLSRS